MRQVTGYCGFCGVHCPTVTTVDGHRVISVEPDRSHPFGGAICAKGRAAPEIPRSPAPGQLPDAAHPPEDRPRPRLGALLLGRGARPDRAKAARGARVLGAAGGRVQQGDDRRHRPPDTEPWLHRLVHLFGTPNLGVTTHLCQWPRDTGAALLHVRHAALPMPDVPRSRCIVLWGANPSGDLPRLGIDVIAAKARGARLLVIDPRRVGAREQGGPGLQVRPGTDGALALA